MSTYTLEEAYLTHGSLTCERCTFLLFIHTQLRPELTLLAGVFLDDKPLQVVAGPLQNECSENIGVIESRIGKDLN